VSVAYVYRAEATIDAPREAVWAVLADLGRYAWNPFTPEVRGELVVGRPIRMKVVMGLGRLVVQTETVLEVAAPERLSWGLVSLPRWLLHAERVQTLTAVGTRTRYETVDAISGVLSPLVHLRYGHGIQVGFEAMAGALKDRVEGLADAGVGGTTA
jgi:hypothetical protein